jgi:hypothetical protein
MMASKALAAHRADVTMSYQIAPLFCRPWTLLGIERELIESHYENNYGGAFARLNEISAELAALDPATTPARVIRRLKQDEAAARVALRGGGACRGGERGDLDPRMIA